MKEGIGNYLIGAIGGTATTVLIFIIIRLTGIIPKNEWLLTLLISCTSGIAVWSIGWYVTKSDKSYKDLKKTYESKADAVVVDNRFNRVDEDIRFLNKYKANMTDIENIKLLISGLANSYAYNQAEHQELGKAIREVQVNVQESISKVYDKVIEIAEKK